MLRKFVCEAFLYIISCLAIRKTLISTHYFTVNRHFPTHYFAVFRIFQRTILLYNERRWNNFCKASQQERTGWFLQESSYTSTVS